MLLSLYRDSYNYITWETLDSAILTTLYLGMGKHLVSRGLHGGWPQFSSHLIISQQLLVP
jgi:hypothetical protein